MLGEKEAAAGRIWAIQNCSPEVIGMQWDDLLTSIHNEQVIRVGDNRRVLM
jgi:hypothetical protein